MKFLRERTILGKLKTCSCQIRHDQYIKSHRLHPAVPNFYHRDDWQENPKRIPEGGPIINGFLKAFQHEEYEYPMRNPSISTQNISTRDITSYLQKRIFLQNPLGSQTVPTKGTNSQDMDLPVEQRIPKPYILKYQPPLRMTSILYMLPTNRCTPEIRCPSTKLKVPLSSPSLNPFENLPRLIIKESSLLRSG